MTTGANHTPFWGVWGVSFFPLALGKESAMATLRERMTKDMQLRGLSLRTQEAYLRAMTKMPNTMG
jgi:hypothetical protein